MGKSWVVDVIPYMVPNNGILGENYESEPPNLIMFAVTSELFVLCFPNFQIPFYAYSFRISQKFF